MAQLDPEAIKNLIKLCRIECSPQELEQLESHLKKILNYVHLLQEVETDDLAPFNGVMDLGQVNLREDVANNTLTRERFLANAPDHVGGMIRVPPVIKQNT